MLCRYIKSTGFFEEVYVETKSVNQNLVDIDINVSENQTGTFTAGASFGTLDGVTLSTNDRVLVKDQSTASQNGIYVVGSSPARAADLAAGNIYHAIYYGLNAMGPHNTQINDTERWLITMYVQELQKGN